MNQATRILVALKMLEEIRAASLANGGVYVGTFTPNLTSVGHVLTDPDKELQEALDNGSLRKYRTTSLEIEQIQALWEL